MGVKILGLHFRFLCEYIILSSGAIHSVLALSVSRVMVSILFLEFAV